MFILRKLQGVPTLPTKRFARPEKIQEGRSNAVKGGSWEAKGCKSTGGGRTWYGKCKAVSPLSLPLPPPLPPPPSPFTNWLRKLSEVTVQYYNHFSPFCELH